MADEVTRKVRYLMYTDYDPASEANAKKMVDLFKWVEDQKAKAAEEAAKKTGETEAERIKRLLNEYEKQNDAVRKNNKEMHDGLLKTGEGVVTLTRGFAELGIVQEKDAEQMLRLVIQMQAGVDITKGLIDGYRGVTQMVGSYQAAVVAATAAEEALAAARAKSAAAGGGIPGQIAGAGIAGTSVSAATAAGGSLAPLATGITALTGAIFSLPGAIALALTSVVGAGAMAFNVGGSRDAAAGAIGRLGRDGGWGEWGVGLMNSALGVHSAFNEFSPSGLVERAIYGESLASLQRKAEASGARADRTAAGKVADLDMFNRHNFAAQTEFNLQQSALDRSYANRMTLAGLAGTPGEGAALTGDILSSAMNDLQSAQQRSAVASAMPGGREREAAIERAAQAELAAINRVIALRQQAVGLERQATNERLAGVREETAELQKQMDMAKQRQQDAENRLASSKERFGALDEATQRRVIDAKRLADTQGVGALSREQLALLQGVGTQGASDIARQGFTDIADAAGFENYFGKEERKLRDDNKAVQSALEIKLNAQRDIRVTLEGDIEKLTDRLGEYMADLVNQREKTIAEQSARKARQKLAERAQQTNLTPGQTNIGG